MTQHRDIFRLARETDIDAILSFTHEANEGLTNVPNTYERVQSQVLETQATLNKEAGANRVLFVVERDGEVMGISAIILSLGGEVPFYNFKRTRHSGRSTNPRRAVDYETLQLTTDFHNYSEVASLYMGPKGRGKGLSRLLSMGRFGYIQNNKNDFRDGLMAEILGWVDDNNVSPFWQHLASRFIDMDFDNADKLSTVDKRFIVDLLPELPIMLNLLPQIVTDVTGRPHKNSRAAMKMLESIGFEKTDMVDVFDGGPTVKCHKDKTWIARTTTEVEEFKALEKGELCLHFSGTGLDFKASMGQADLQHAIGDPYISDFIRTGDSPVYIAQIKEPVRK